MTMDVVWLGFASWVNSYASEWEDHPKYWGIIHLSFDSLPWNCPATSAAATAKSLQSCPTLCDPIDGSPPGFAIPGILQARILEWVAFPFSRVSSQSRD